MGNVTFGLKQPYFAGLIVLFSASEVSAISCDYFEYGTELVDGVAYCSSSYLPKSTVASYRPGNLERFERERSQAWCEGSKGFGEGQWIEMQVEPSATIQTIYISNGYQKTNNSFQDNPRARRVTISTDSGLFFSIALADEWGEQEIHLNDWHSFSTMKLTVKTVYPGRKYQDLCISGFGIDFEERREFEWQEMQNN